MSYDSKKRYEISANGTTAEADYFKHSGGILRFGRHDASTVSAGTTTLKYRLISTSGLQTVKDLSNTAELTESGFLELSLPECELAITTASYGGSGNITIDLARKPNSL